MTNPDMLEQARALAFSEHFSPDDLGGDLGTMSLRNPDGPALFSIAKALAADNARLRDALDANGGGE